MGATDRTIDVLRHKAVGPFYVGIFKRGYFVCGPGTMHPVADVREAVETRDRMNSASTFTPPLIGWPT